MEPLPANPAESSQTTKLVWILGILLLGIIGVTFSPSLGADFVWGDDTINIYNNPHIREVDSKTVGWMFSDFDYVRRYMPLGWLGLALNYQLTGPSAMGFHVGNMLFHVANAALIFVLLFRLLAFAPFAHSEKTSVRWTCAWIGAVLWAVHPFRVETVAWASGRIYAQATLFFLLAMLSYLRAVEPHQDPSRQRRFYWCSVAAFVASLISYPIAMGGAVVFIILDFYPLRRLNAKAQGGTGLFNSRIWLEKVPFVLASALVLGLTVWARVHTKVFAEAPGVDEFGLAHRLMQAFYSWGYYVWKTWWPTNLSPYYETLLRFSPFDWPLLVGLLLVAATTALLVWKRRTYPAAAAVWLAYLVMMVPMVGLTEHPHFTNDRYVYIVALGWSVLLTTLLYRFWPIVRIRAAMLAFTGVACVSWGIASFRQSWKWLDTESLIEYAVGELGDDPYQANILMGYSFWYLERGEALKAADVYRRVIKVTPSDPNPHCYLADILADQKQFGPAEKHYRAAVALRPHHRNARQNLGVLLAEQQRLNEAAEQFAEVLKYFPDDARGHHNLSLLLGKIGRHEEARFHSAEAIRYHKRAKASANPFQQ